MSPQQLTGKASRATDDIYALGATLYELLTSKPPFFTGDLTHQILHVAPEPMEERLAEFDLANNIPADVAALVMACLAKEPAQRPQSTRAVAGWIGLKIERKSTPESVLNEIPPVPGPQDTLTAMEEPETASPATRGIYTVYLLTGVIAALLVCVAAVWMVIRRQSSNYHPSSGRLVDAAKMELASQPAPSFSGELQGTLWLGRDSDGENFCLKFLTDGTLAYQAGRGIRPNGNWQQDGGNISIDINDGFAHLTGMISGGKMKGDARSHNGKKWKWEAVPK
jgi:serine/threonine protein kinase